MLVQRKKISQMSPRITQLKIYLCKDNCIINAPNMAFTSFTHFAQLGDGCSLKCVHICWPEFYLSVLPRKAHTAPCMRNHALRSCCDGGPQVQCLTIIADDAVLALSSGNHGLECWLAHAWPTQGGEGDSRAGCNIMSHVKLTNYIYHERNSLYLFRRKNLIVHFSNLCGRYLSL